MKDQYSDEEHGDEALFALHKKRTEKFMRVLVVIIVIGFVFTLYFFLTND